MAYQIGKEIQLFVSYFAKVHNLFNNNMLLTAMQHCIFLFVANMLLDAFIKNTNARVYRHLIISIKEINIFVVSIKTP